MKIGVFDSGVGGLTVLRALAEAMPGHDLYFLGDTARVPYGTRSPRVIEEYTVRSASFLLEHRIDALVLACNTATTWALPTLKAALEPMGIPVFGVIKPGVQTALRVHQGGAIAILGTEATIAGGRYQALLSEQIDAPILGIPCPLFVPLAEEGLFDGPIVRLVVQRYLSEHADQIGTAILGCTHYPLLKTMIERALPAAQVIDSANATAEAVRRLLPSVVRDRELRFFVTDNPVRFTRTSALFLGQTPQRVERVRLNQIAPAFKNALRHGDALQ